MKWLPIKISHSNCGEPALSCKHQADYEFLKSYFKEQMWDFLIYGHHQTVPLWRLLFPVVTFHVILLGKGAKERETHWNVQTLSTSSLCNSYLISHCQKQRSPPEISPKRIFSWQGILLMVQPKQAPEFVFSDSRCVSQEYIIRRHTCHEHASHNNLTNHNT